MKTIQALFRGAYFLAAAVCIIIWIFMAMGTAALTYFAYGNPLGTYTGQPDDRHAAWIAIILLIAYLAFIVFVFVLPIARRSRQRTRA